MPVALSLCHMVWNLADFTVSFPACQGSEWRGMEGFRGSGREQQGMHTRGCKRDLPTGVKGHQSGNSHQSLPHLPIVFPWKRTKPHCVLGLLISVL